MSSRNKMILFLGIFATIMLALILIPVLAWEEFVVSVCVVLLLAVLMAVLLHKTELWVHGIILAVMLTGGLLIGRFWMMFLCVHAYVAAIGTLHFAFGSKKTE